MFRNELAQEKNVFRRNDSATGTVLHRHMRSVCQNLIWNASRIYVYVFRRSRAATLARLPLRDCRPPAATAPGALAVPAPVRHPLATSGSVPSTNASWPAKTLGRHTRAV